MTNAVNLASAAGTGFAFRNILINGEVTRINQRVFNGTWSGLADGAYGYDRWKKSGTNIQQVVEDGNYVPSAVYTLSGNNVTTQQLTAPASGHWTITVPNTATNVQLERGTVATPFERRPYGLEEALCQRYYQTQSDLLVSSYTGTGGTIYNDFTLPVLMRSGPSTSITTPTYLNASGLAVNSAYVNRVRFSLVVSSTGYGAAYGQLLTLSAEL